MYLEVELEGGVKLSVFQVSRTPVRDPNNAKLDASKVGEDDDKETLTKIKRSQIRS